MPKKHQSNVHVIINSSAPRPFYTFFCWGGGGGFSVFRLAVFSIQLRESGSLILGDLGDPGSRWNMICLMLWMIGNDDHFIIEHGMSF